MRSNYKKLGQFIKLVSVKNKDLNVDLLLGVSITKRFIPSIANIVGTDMSTYKVVTRNQFAYGSVTSRNGEKISIALLTEDKCLVSSSYTVFEIADTEKLDPEYLMMWFRRTEFDRYARFMSHGTVREQFGWDEMCDAELPVPSIEKQREIVREYNVVNDRISLNDDLTQKLEDTAQAIYKQWFVDFEFPISKEYAESIDKPELEGKPYKSSGGEMKYCEELEQDIPIDWVVDKLGNLSTIRAGGDKPKRYSINRDIECVVPIYSNSTEQKGLYGWTDKAKIQDRSITVSARGGIGFTVLRDEPFVPIVRLIVVIPENHLHLNYLYQFLKRYNYDSFTTASAQAQLTSPDVSEFSLLKPDSDATQNYEHVANALNEKIKVKEIENQTLIKLREILLSRLAMV